MNILLYVYFFYTYCHVRFDLVEAENWVIQNSLYISTVQSNSVYTFVSKIINASVKEYISTHKLRLILGKQCSSINCNYNVFE